MYAAPIPLYVHNLINTVGNQTNSLDVELAQPHGSSSTANDAEEEPTPITNTEEDEGHISSSSASDQHGFHSQGVSSTPSTPSVATEAEIVAPNSNYPIEDGETPNDPVRSSPLSCRPVLEDAAPRTESLSSVASKAMASFYEAPMDHPAGIR